MARTLTQRDIARRAGVSQAAVSMVLGDKAGVYKIAPETQERIRQIAAEAGYVPDINGRSLRGGRNGLIGVHTYEVVFPVGPDAFYHDFLIGIEEAAVAARQDLVLFASTQRPDGTRSIYTDRGNRLRITDGAVFLGLRQNTEELVRLAAEGYPFVFVGHRELPGQPVPYVTADYAAATSEIVARLAHAGHRSVAYLGGAVRSNPSEARFSAFVEAAARNGVAVTDTLFVDATQLGPELPRSLAAGRATAVLVESCEVAEPFVQAARAAGLDLPRDPFAVLLEPPSPALAEWSHLTIPRQEMGRRAVGLLLDLLDGQIQRDHHITLPCPPAVLRWAKNPSPLPS